MNNLVRRYKSIVTFDVQKKKVFLIFFISFIGKFNNKTKKFYKYYPHFTKKKE